MLDNTKQIGVGIGFLPCKTQLNFITITIRYYNSSENVSSKAIVDCYDFHEAHKGNNGSKVAISSPGDSICRNSELLTERPGQIHNVC